MPQFVNNRGFSPAEVFELAGKAKAAGYTIDQADLEERTGFKLVKDENPQPGGFGTFPNASMPLQFDGNPLQNARKGEGASDVPQKGETPVDAILRGFSADMAPVADKIKAILALEDDEERRQAAASLMEELPSLLPDDPELAALMEEDLAKAFAESVCEGGIKVENTPRGGNPGNTGQFSKHPGSGAKEPETKKTSDNFGTTDEAKLTASKEENRKRGNAVVTHLLAQKRGSVDKAMFRPDTGWIAIEYGDKGHGLAHIAKHPGCDRLVPEIISEGECYKHDKNRRKVYLIKGSNVLVLSKRRDGRLLITDYNDASEEELKRYKSKGRYHVKGDN